MVSLAARPHSFLPGWRLAARLWPTLQAMLGVVTLAILAFAAAVAASAQGAAVITGARLLGAGEGDTVEDLARATDGKLYIYGQVGSSAGFGLSSAAFSNAGQFDVFVAKVDPATLAPDWVVPIGRDRSTRSETTFRDKVDAFALGADGHVYVAAYTTSTRYPLAGGPYTGWGGGKYVYRIDSAGTVTAYAGPLDPAIRTVRTLLADAQGNVFLSGRAAKSLATTAGAMTSAVQLGTATEGPYLMKIGAATRAVSWSTFLGVPGGRPGTANEQFCRQPFADDATTAYAMALAADGSVYLAGQAHPQDLPVTPGAADTLDAAYRDAFVMRVNASGSAVMFVARFGGRDNDRATGLLIGPDGNATVAGKWLDSGSVWYGPRGGFQASITRQWSWSNPCESMVPTEAGFLLKVGPGGAQVGSTAMIGAVGGDLAGWMAWPDPMPLRLAHDNAGNVFVAGTTDSGQSLPTQLPFVPDEALYHPGNRATRAFLLKVRLSDLSLVWGSRFGARLSHAGAVGVTSDALGNVFVAGNAPGTDAFPIVNAAGSGRPHRFSSAFLTRIHEAPVDLALATTPAQGVAGTPVQLRATLGDRSYVGNVEFRNRGVLVGAVPLSSGIATLSMPFPAGVHTLTATVRGSGVWNGNSSAPRMLVVQQP